MLEPPEPVDAALVLVELPEVVELELLEQAARATKIAVAVENTAARLLKRRLETGSILKNPFAGDPTRGRPHDSMLRRLLKVTTRALFVTRRGFVAARAKSEALLPIH
jgi:hypothetical protein